MKTRAVVLSLMLATGIVQAQTVYRVTQPDGTVEFTDSPPPGQPAQAVVVPPLNTAKPPVSPRDAHDDAPNPERKVAYEALEITKPAEGESIWGPVGRVDINLSVEPSLRSGDKVELKLDGQSIGGGHATAITLTEVARGTHTVQAVVKDSSGRVMAQSNSVTFTKHQGQQRRLLTN